jgi:hypothetical protein
VAEQNWYNTATLSSTDDFQYGYDRDSNVQYRNNTVNTAFGELYHASCAGLGYNNLNQMTDFARGVLSSSGGGVLDTVASPTRTQDWSLDPLGNWASLTTNGTAQTRTTNQDPRNLSPHLLVSNCKPHVSVTRLNKAALQTCTTSSATSWSR